MLQNFNELFDEYFINESQEFKDEMNNFFNELNNKELKTWFYLPKVIKSEFNNDDLAIKLYKAIVDERFEDAALYRDEMKKNDT